MLRVVRVVCAASSLFCARGGSKRRGRRDQGKQLFELVGQGKERRGGGGSHYRSGCRTEAVQEENRSERKGHASTPFPGHPLIP